MTYETENSRLYLGRVTSHFIDFAIVATMATTVIIITLSVICAMLLAVEITRHIQNVKKLEERLKAIEDANRKRMPYQSQEELIDAMTAIILYLQERKIQDSFIENAAGHITNALAVGTKREKEN